MLEADMLDTGMVYTKVMMVVHHGKIWALQNQSTYQK